MITESEKAKLHKIFAEICSKFSLYKFKNQNVYVKHKNNLDDLEVDFLYDNKFNELKSAGVFTEKDKLDYLIKNNLWSKKQEDQIVYSKNTINDLYLNKRKVFKFADIANYQKQIEENQDFLIKLLNERAELIGETCESGARKSADLLIIQKSFFLDKELTKPIYSDEEFENLSAEETDELFVLYRKFLIDLGDQNIRKISICDFFRETFGLSEDIFNFFGVALVNLTGFQSKLLLYGRYFSGLLQNNDIPEAIKDNVEKIEEYCTGKQSLSQIIEKQGDGDGIVSLPGVSAKELAFYGVDNPINDSKQNDVKEIKKIAEQSYGELSLEQSQKFGFV